MDSCKQKGKGLPEVVPAVLEVAVRDMVPGLLHGQFTAHDRVIATYYLFIYSVNGALGDPFVDEAGWW